MAIVLRDQLRQQVQDNTAAKTNVTLGYLLDEWLSGHHVEETVRGSASDTAEARHYWPRSTTAAP